jgi:CubicO group peptidase (beta-lactamase class C family)
VRTLNALFVALLVFTAAGPRAHAQSLPISLFERYLESLRQQAGIPGLSAAIIQDGRIVWDQGYGYQDIDKLVATTPNTPYPILGLSQTVSSTLLIQQCLELRNRLALSDRVRRWVSDFPEENTTVDQLLQHAAPGGGFKYDANRYATVRTVVTQCAGEQYPHLLAAEIMSRLSMKESVPGHDLATGPDRRWFSSSELDRYADLLRKVAVPYRVDSRGRPTRSDYTPPALSGSTGIVSTVRDFARFDAALDDDFLIEAENRQRAWESSGSIPTGLGWFVQRYNGERVVWQFGLVRDAYSALYIKVPGRNLSVILFANSDGLAAPYNLSNGDITTSLIAQTFLRLFIG